MDKKMAKVTKELTRAQKDIEKGKKSQGVKLIKKAKKENRHLTKIDRDVRDPEIKAYKKMKGRC